MNAPPHCAICGSAIPPRAKSCPDCGADERTGWRDASIYDGLDLPDEAWRDGEDTGLRPLPARVNGLPWYWWLVGVLLLGLLFLGFAGWR
jgi:hypothetical protein